MRWYVGVTYCVSGALCGEALGFLGLFPRGGSRRGLRWCLKVFPFASLGSGTGGGMVALRSAFKQRRSRLPAPRQGGGVRLRGVVWLSRSSSNPVCRFAQDDTVGDRGAVPYMFGIKYSTVKPDDMVFCFLGRYGILFFYPTPRRPTCHPERSGTTRQESRATTNHCRTANPAPSGAPAGGISVVPAHPRNATTPPPGTQPERSEGADFEAPPQTPLRTFFRKSPKNSKASPQRAPETQYVTITYHLTGALCGEVLGVLRTFSERRF